MRACRPGKMLLAFAVSMCAGESSAAVAAPAVAAHTNGGGGMAIALTRPQFR